MAKKLKTFGVSFTVVVPGDITVKANNEKEASDFVSNMATEDLIRHSCNSDEVTIDEITEEE